jgi:hypothetical protein
MSEEQAEQLVLELVGVLAQYSEPPPLLEAYEMFDKMKAVLMNFETT